MTLIPDVEKVLTTYLQPKVTPLGAKIRGRTPSSSATAWVRLTVLDAPASYPDHLVDALVQLDCYAGAGEGGQEEASLLARTVRAALVDAPNNDHDSAVVTGCAIVGYLRNPDTFFEPARDRFIITAQIWVHGVPA